MHQHPDVVRALIRDRQAELQRAAERSARRNCESGSRPTIEAARNATGWLLIDMGLRLAMPRNAIQPSAARRPR